MARSRRNRRKLEVWEQVHNELAEILQETRWRKGNREWVKLAYFGTAPRLRKHCVRLLNLIDSMKETEDGLPTENRWT